jgi:dTDP-4-dehydrorhamnose 3,5-epimerase
MPITFTKLKIPDVILVQGQKFSDDRGYFKELFKRTTFKELGDYEFVQDNFSVSKKGTVRGLHYQLAPKSQGKLVQVLRGRVFDVAVDIRKSSPTFGQWVGVELSADNDQMLFVPPGFAHGFMALEDDTYFLYKCTDEYDKASEAGILWNDETIGIEWPQVAQALVSEKDAILPEFGLATVFD